MQSEFVIDKKTITLQNNNSEYLKNSYKIDLW